MTWTYTIPIATDLDRVRFLIQDTVQANALVSNEEIDYALECFEDVRFASAMVLRALAVRFGRAGSVRVGDVSVSNADVDRWLGLVAQYDPIGVTTGSAMVLPFFGGESISEKETYEDDSDAVQPWFTREGDNIPGGPDGASEDDYDG